MYLQALAQRHLVFLCYSLSDLQSFGMILLGDEPPR